MTTKGRGESMLRKLPVYVVIVVLIGTVLLLPGPAPAQKVLKIGYPVWVGYGPLFLADKKGFLKNEGVNVQFVNMEVNPRYVALAAGQIEGLMTPIGTMAQRVRAGFEIAAVMSHDDSRSGQWDDDD